nr:PREDICTED: cell division cycle-associated protein 2 isoform X1 [Lepisosteus oculatus]
MTSDLTCSVQLPPSCNQSSLSSAEANPAAPHEDDGRLGDLSAHCPPLPQPALGQYSTPPPLDFTQLTPADMGISSQSFMPASKGRDKSRLSQLKARRRSTIGVRGSPETNSLICYIALQRRTNPSKASPHQASPFSPHSSALHQKMKSFQSCLESLDETDQTEPQLGDQRGEDDLKETQNGKGVLQGKENRLPEMLPSPKRQRLDTRADDMKEGGAGDSRSPGRTPYRRGPSTWSAGLAEEEEEVLDLPAAAHSPGQSGARVRKTPARAETGSGAGAGGSTVSERDGWKTPGSSRTVAEEGAARGDWPWQSPFRSPSLVSKATRCPGPAPVPFPALTPVQAARPDETETLGGSTARREKKRVRFGLPLSPEFFDKRLPPNTPLQKGGTPAPASPSTGSRLRPVLKKTPLRLPALLPELDFDIPEVSTTPVCEPSSETEDLGIAPLVFLDEPVCDEPQAAGPLPALQDSQPETGVTFQDETVCDEPQPPALDGVAVEDSQAETGTEPPPPAEQPTSTGVPVQSRGRKRKKPAAVEHTQPRRASTSRSAAKSASGKMKESAKRRWGCKPVDRSLYGERDYASKNPSLSPITERLSSGSCVSVNSHEELALPYSAGEGTWETPEIPLGDTASTDSVGSAAAAGHDGKESADGGHLPLMSAEAADPEPPECSLERAEEADGKGPAGPPAITDAAAVLPEEPAPVPAGEEDAAGAGLLLHTAATQHAAELNPAAQSRTADEPAWELPGAACPEDAQPERKPRRGRRPKGGRKGCPGSRSLGAQAESSSEIGHTEAAVSSDREVEPSTPPERTGSSLPAHSAPQAQHARRHGDDMARDATGTPAPQGQALPAPETDGATHGEAAEHPEGRSRGRRSVRLPLPAREEAGEGGEQPQEAGTPAERAGGDCLAPAAVELGWPLPALAPWQQEISIEEVLKPLPREHVRRSMRNRRNSDAAGLSWVPRSSPDAGHCYSLRRRSRKVHGRQPAAETETP